MQLKNKKNKKSALTLSCHFLITIRLNCYEKYVQELKKKQEERVEWLRKKLYIKMNSSHIDSKQYIDIYIHEIISLLSKIMLLTKLTK